MPIWRHIWQVRPDHIGGNALAIHCVAHFRVSIAHLILSYSFEHVSIRDVNSPDLSTSWFGHQNTNIYQFVDIWSKPSQYKHTSVDQILHLVAFLRSPSKCRKSSNKSYVTSWAKLVLYARPTSPNITGKSDPHSVTQEQCGAVMMRSNFSTMFTKDTP